MREFLFQDWTIKPPVDTALAAILANIQVKWKRHGLLHFIMFSEVRRWFHDKSYLSQSGFRTESQNLRLFCQVEPNLFFWIFYPFKLRTKPFLKWEPEPESFCILDWTEPFLLKVREPRVNNVYLRAGTVVDWSVNNIDPKSEQRK